MTLWLPTVYMKKRSKGAEWFLISHWISFSLYLPKLRLGSVDGDLEMHLGVVGSEMMVESLRN